MTSGTKEDNQFEATNVSKAEQETIIRWDQTSGTADLYTAHAAQARQWARRGYPMELVGRDKRGKPTGWRCQVPKEAVRFRRVQDGQVVKRRTGPGRPFAAINGAFEDRTGAGETLASSEDQSQLERANNRVFDDQGAQR